MLRRMGRMIIEAAFGKTLLEAVLRSVWPFIWIEIGYLSRVYTPDFDHYAGLFLTFHSILALALVYALFRALAAERDAE